MKIQKIFNKKLLIIWRVAFAHLRVVLEECRPRSESHVCFRVFDFTKMLLSVTVTIDAQFL